MHRDNETTPGFFDDWDRQPPDQAQAGAQAGETVEQKLAQYAFVREEREREVRLIFRDVPAYEMAVSFRAAGAHLITIAGERVEPSGVPEAPAPENPERALVEAHPRESARRRRRHEQQTHQPPAGDVVLRYFFSLGETVYTVILAAPAGVMGSIAAIYPVAALSEQEIQQRLQVVFT